MAKLPQNFVTFNNTEYSVCNIKNQIIVTGGRTKQNDVWIYQVRKMIEHQNLHVVCFDSLTWRIQSFSTIKNGGDRAMSLKQKFGLL